MPVEMKIWRIDDDRPRALTAAILPSERDLEEFLEKDPTLLGIRLLAIGRQVHTPHGKFIDLLAIDVDGNLHVLELKRDKTPRDVVAQVLDYGSWVTTLDREQVRAIAAQHLGSQVEGAFEDLFGETLPDELNSELQLTIVATELDSSSERIVTYLRGLGVPVNAVFFSYLEDDDRRYLARSWLATAQESGTGPNTQTKSKRAAWNGHDWYVAFGGSLGRVWDDGLNFGFVSAGGGIRYSSRLRSIPVGDRVNVYLPGHGYVAVGITLEPARRFSQAEVVVDGRQVPLADQPLQGSYEYGTPGAPESDDVAEWVIPVRWIAAVPAADAYRETGMFANPNVVCALRQEFTLERLAAHFELGDQDG